MSAPAIGDAVTVARLAWADLIHQRHQTLCQVLALAAVLAPLLVLFGVRTGVMQGLRDELLQDPRTREIVLIGQGGFNAAWFDETSALDGVAFVLPRSRFISATMDLRTAGNRSGEEVAVELVPTAEGDPLTGGLPVPQAAADILISQRTAERLQLAAGDLVQGSIGRIVDGRRQSVRLELNVLGIVPMTRFQRDAAFVTVALMDAAEAYRDGQAVPDFGWTGTSVSTSPRPVDAKKWASFRLYAESLDDVETLRHQLATAGLEVRTEAAAIEQIRSLDRNLTLVFWLVALVGLVGYGVSLIASMTAAVDRRRRELAVLQLVGLDPARVVLFPVFQAVAIAGMGAGVAILAALLVGEIVNGLFASALADGAAVCRLRPIDLAAAFLLTAILALPAALAAGKRAAMTDPAEALRDV